MTRSAAQRKAMFANMNKRRPQTTLLHARVISSKNKWTVEKYKNTNTNKPSYAVSDGRYVDTPIVYSGGGIAYDNPHRVPKYVKSMLTEAVIEDRKPHFIKEPFGLPRELQATGKFKRRTTK